MNTVPTCHWCDPNHAPLPETEFTCRNCGFEAAVSNDKFLYRIPREAGFLGLPPELQEKIERIRQSIVRGAS